MQSWWKNPRIIGNLAYITMLGLSATLRIKVQRHPAIDPNKAYLFAFWHGKQILPSFVMPRYHKTRRCAMVSPSRDGAMLATYLEKIGYEIVRGSSRDNNVSALIRTKNLLDENVSIGFGIDGPIGPIHVAKPGLIFLARKANVQIVPIGSAFSNCWVFHKAWDKFELPKPFSTAGLVVGEPYHVPMDTDIKQECLLLEKLLHNTEQEAVDLIR
jgi:lysophospholipid acyltransferase (LPLAT)-like uncharacterized protein